MKKYFLQAYRILEQIYVDGAYSNMAFAQVGTSDMSTKLVYGVLETDIRCEYILSQFIDKKPQRAIWIMLKLGVYALENLTDVPAFAVVSECVEAVKAVGKGGAGGFVNAVLKKVSRKEYTLPAETDGDYLCVTYSKPQWFINKLISQYGRETAIAILSARSTCEEHIRVNSRLTDISAVTKALDKAGERYRKSDVGGLIVRGTETVKRLFDKGCVTYQSPSSMLAVQALSPTDGSAVLDLCSAPGGKAVYISELCPHSTVIACEIHPHRIALIQKYKQRMHVPNVKAVAHDATVFNEDWKNAFDFVLVDAPCSCFGTFLKHPDVFLTRGEEQISNLSSVQRAILHNAAQYVKEGGYLLYSTCTVFDEENGQVVKSLLDKGEFEPESISAIKHIDGGRYADNRGYVQILPHGEYDGFYIARLKRVRMKRQ